MTAKTCDDLATEVRQPIFQFPEQTQLAQLEIRAAADLVAAFEYDIDSDENIFWIRFAKARAYRYHAEAHCTRYHLEGTFDQLIEIEGSHWQSTTTNSSSYPWVLRHFMFYADSHGCLEVLAADFETGGMKPRPAVRD